MKKAWLALEKLFGEAFTPRFNPMYHLGAIGIFLMWILLASGIYLFIFYRISIPYESVEYLTVDQWYLGGYFRSLHRYASDALIIVALAHLAREFITGRFRHWRWLAWVTGAVTLHAIWATGLIGYLMVWDERAQLIAEITLKFLDNIPIFGESLSMAFTTAELVTTLFFLVILFLHLTLPVALFVLLWLHLMRTSKPVINPPKLVGVVVLAALTVVSVIKPARSLEPVDFSKVVSDVGIDWFYLFPYPLFKALPMWAAGGVLVLASALITVVPWLFPARRNPRAEVLPDDCTGCEQCHEDCPYAAVVMMPKEEETGMEALEAKIIPERCSSCGICVGSCDFEAVAFPLKQREDVLDEITSLVSNTGEPVLVIKCAHIHGGEKLAGGDGSFMDLDGVKVLEVPCAGMTNPAWIQHAIEEGAKGVFFLGCSHGDCHFRTGNRILEERIEGKRWPILPETVDRTRITSYWETLPNKGELKKKVREFKDGLPTAGDGQTEKEPE